MLLLRVPIGPTISKEHRSHLVLHFGRSVKKRIPVCCSKQTRLHPNRHAELLNPAFAQLVGDGDAILVLIKVTVEMIELEPDLLKHLDGGRIVLVDLDKELLQLQIAIAYGCPTASRPYTTSSPAGPCSSRNPCGDPSYQQPSR